MADVFDVLKRDHEEVEQMLAQLDVGKAGAAGADPDWLRSRKKMVERVIIEESKHEAVEEEFFWPAVREHVPDGDRLADEAVEQEQKAKQILDELDRTDPGDGRFEELLAGFIKDAREHIRFEETRVWPGLRAALTGEQADRLGDKLVAGKKTAPTRPHPNVPPKPGILKATGPVAAMADRAGDAVSGRGKD
jgi:hypothetical protein